MCVYESLLVAAEKDGMEVVEKEFKSGAKGLCNGNKIGINKKLTLDEKSCVLAEELGHYYTTVGNILNTNNLNNSRQEKRARKWAVNQLITIDDLILAYKENCTNIETTAECLGITTDFLIEAIEVFKAVYGAVCKINGYTIVFSDAGYCIMKEE